MKKLILILLVLAMAGSVFAHSNCKDRYAIPTGDTAFDMTTFSPTQGDSMNHDIATWDSSAATIWTGTGGTNIITPGSKSTNAWFSSAGGITATYYLRNPKAITFTKPSQGDTLK
jgi:hypothetical protein